MWQFSESSTRSSDCNTFNSHSGYDSHDDIILNLDAISARPMKPKLRPLKIRGFRPMSPRSAGFSKQQGNKQQVQLNSVAATHRLTVDFGPSEFKDAQFEYLSRRNDGLQTSGFRICSSGSMTDPDSSLLSPPQSPDLATVKFQINEIETKYFSEREYCENVSPSWTQSRNVSAYLDEQASFEKHASTSETIHENIGPQLKKVKSPAEMREYTPSIRRACVSCGSKHTPCWRPSWDPRSGQLCNSCGLRYRKSRIRCESPECSYVPSKIDLTRSRSSSTWAMRCPSCGANLLND